MVSKPAVILLLADNLKERSVLSDE
jgi:hypothetical protein